MDTSKKVKSTEKKDILLEMMIRLRNESRRKD